jgi:ABC-type transport system involved in multi-copper enzyme maturation permease subunit
MIAMLLNLFRAEVFKLGRRTMTRVLLLILFAGTIALYGLFWLILRSTPVSADPETLQDLESLRRSLRLEEVRASGLDFVRSLGAILGIIMSVTAISSEYTSGAIRLMLPRAGSRLGFLTAKYLYLLAFVALMLVIGLAGAVLGSLVVSAGEDLDPSVGADFLPLLVVALARTALAMLPYFTLSFFVAVLTRSTAAGITIGLVVLLGEPLAAPLIGLLPGPLDRLADVLPSRNASGLTRANEIVPQRSAQDLPSPWQGAAVLLVYVAVFVALAYRRFLARDVTSGGE